MLNYNLKIIFVLSKWFAGKQDENVIPGAVYLFLTEIQFIWLAFYLLVTDLTGIRDDLSTEAFVGILVITSLFIYYGLRKQVNSIINQSKFDIAYKKLSDSEKIKMRTFALLVLLFSYLLWVVVAILYYRE